MKVDDWNDHWSRFAEAATRNPGQQMRHAIVARRLSEVATGGPRRILDIGSGQGDLLARIRRLWPKAPLLGFEMSESGVRISREKVPDGRFILADLFHPPPELDAYAGWATDAVCVEVLEHVDDPVAFLQSAARYLAPGAQIIVTVPSGPMSAFDRHIGHRRHFTRASISANLSAAGFRVDRVYRCGFPFFNLYRLVVIARGKKLAADIDSGGGQPSSRLAGAIMDLFHILFRLNVADSRFGWQLVAVAKKSD